MVLTGGRPQEHNNFKIPGTGNDLYGKQRLELAIHLRDAVLPMIKRPFFIENGTLLGAWRNGKFIEHDDDFDFGILLDKAPKPKDTALSILSRIEKHLGSSYECRLVTTYATKIEVYDPSVGAYMLSPKYGGANYHYVTADLQFYCETEAGGFQQMYYLGTPPHVVRKDRILPLSKIVLEGEPFPAPRRTEEFLVDNYGSLDPAAKYNSVTGKYHL